MTKRARHFGLEFDMFKEYIHLKEMLVQHVDTNELVADLLTKPLAPSKFIPFRDLLMGGLVVQAHFK